MLKSVLSAPNVQSALQKDSPADLVQLSEQAMQLQEANLLFGNADGAQTPTTYNPSDSLMQALQSSMTAANASPTAVTNPQAQDLAALFGIAPAGDPLLNMLL